MNKIIISKIFLLFEIAFVKDENVIIQQNSNIVNSSSTLLNGLSPNLIALNKIEIILEKIEIIFKINLEIENENFFLNLISHIDKLEDLINYYIKKNNWRVLKKISYILRFDKIHELIKFDIQFKKIFNLAKLLLKNECLEIKIESIKILTILSKSNNFWDEVINYVNVEIIKSKNYYYRKLYCNFFSELLRIFSYKFLNEKGQIEEFVKLLNDNNQILSSFFKILKFFFPLINEDKYKFLILNKLENLRKQIKENILNDFELIKVIKFFLFFFSRLQILILTMKNWIENLMDLIILVKSIKKKKKKSTMK